MRILETTVGSENEAHAIGRTLIEERLCACVQIAELNTSIYRWNDGVMQEKEWLLRAKTSPEKAAAAAARIKTLHPYEVPELLSYPAAILSPAYAEWLADAVE